MPSAITLNKLSSFRLFRQFLLFFFSLDFFSLCLHFLASKGFEMRVESFQIVSIWLTDNGFRIRITESKCKETDNDEGLKQNKKYTKQK